MTRTGFMIYGAYGFTGELITRVASRRGHRPLLAGRRRAELGALARELDLPSVAVDLESGADLRRALERVQTVVHAAGPFVHTARPMLEACLDTGTHYVDITGELPVFEEAFARDDDAKKRDVVLMPGLGFDVVPSDCLASFVAAHVPGAEQLDIAVAVLGRASAGTVKASLEALTRGNFVRREGQLVRIAFGEGVQEVRFYDRDRTVLPVPWGDLVTAYHSTGIPNITASLAVPAPLAHALGAAHAPLSKLAPPLADLFGRKRLQSALFTAVQTLVKGPDEHARQSGAAQFWARASAADGRDREAWLETIDGYAFTAESVVHAVERVARGGLSGTLTPSRAFGNDFVLAIRGSKRHERLHEAE